jgi:polygalacturonase
VPAPALGAPAGAKTSLWDAAEPNQWDAYQDYGHSHFHNSFIWGENLHDISILGPGMIDGAGLLTNAGEQSTIANKALALKLCRNVTLRDFAFYRGGHFCILATGVDNFTLDNVKFDTNRDAIDIDSCKNVRVSNCYVNSPTDDGICLKADYALGFARPCENVTITNCQVSGYVTGTLLDGTFDRSLTFAADKDGPTGRIKFGTESNGGFKNITISNCVFDHCRGLAIESVDGGVIEDVTVSNLTMREINNAPIFIRLGDRARGPADKTPVAQIRRINISDISCTALNPAAAVLIAGMPDHPIEDVRLSNIRIMYPGGGTAADAKNVPPEREEKNYPEPSRFGTLPASGFYVRHVKGLEMHHIDVTYGKADGRPAFVLSDVDGADFQHMKVQRFNGVGYFELEKVSDFSTQFVQSVADMKREKVDREEISK